jgi:microcystin-dependent protein
MSTPYLAEIRMFGFNFAPQGWAFCNGQLLPINQNTAVFSLLGTFFGGDGVNTFGLPNMQSRIPVHQGDGQVVGETGGAENVELTLPQMPAHTHQANCNGSAGTDASPKGNDWAQDNNGNAPYSSSGGSTLNANAIAPAGSGSPHPNIAPYLTLNFCIALAGIFPSRS